jgi:hypothetical protein
VTDEDQWRLKGVGAMPGASQVEEEEQRGPATMGSIASVLGHAEQVTEGPCDLFSKREPMALE